jgi:hypothetical protein
MALLLSVLQRLPRLLVVLALACSIGLHWTFLQSLAWTNMLVDNLTTASFSAAIQRTFDGQHPCALCKVVAAGKKSEKRTDSNLSFKKFDGLNQAIAIFVFPPASFASIEGWSGFLETLAHTPPTPPPRAA